MMVVPLVDYLVVKMVVDLVAWSVFHWVDSRDVMMVSQMVANLVASLVVVKVET